MKKFGYDYARGLMTCTFVSDGNSDNFNLTNIFNQTEKPQMLKTDVLVSIIDGRNRHAAIFRSSAELNTDHREWSRGYIRMIFKSRVDGTEMKTGELLKMSNISNEMQGMVRKDTYFISVMNIVFEQTKTFEHDYGTSNRGSRLNDFLDDMRSSQFLIKLSVAT